MILKTRYDLVTRPIGGDEAWRILDWLLDCLHRHGVVEVVLIYGYDWDIGEKSWQDQTLQVITVRDHVKETEDRESGLLGSDDLYIKVNEAVQIHFCHHEHLYLNYDQADLPLAKDLIDYFTQTIGLSR